MQRSLIPRYIATVVLVLIIVGQVGIGVVLTTEAAPYDVTALIFSLALFSLGTLLALWNAKKLPNWILLVITFLYVPVVAFPLLDDVEIEAKLVAVFAYSAVLFGLIYEVYANRRDI
jgi:Zn-dependent protease with chaperone function